MALELHPGEQVIYDGRPSWRSVMALYLQGALAGLVLGLSLIHISEPTRPS